MMMQKAAWMLGLAAMFATAAHAADAKKPAAAPAKAGGATAAEVAQCKSLCETRDNVSCPKAPKEDACNKNCQTAATESAPCRQKFDDWLEFDSKQTWSCDGAGYPQMDASAPGVASTFWECFATTAGATPKAEAAPPVCGASSNDSYCDNCLSQYCPSQSMACGANAECRAIETCIDKCPNANDPPDLVHNCVEKCKSKHTAGVPAFEALNSCSGKCDACGGAAAKALWDQVAKPNQVTYKALTHCTLIAP